jgi:hypothetical protein
MLRSKAHRHLALIVIAFAINSCAQHYTGTIYSDPCGFFSGLLHGFVFPFALIAKIISWVSSIIGISIFKDVQFVVVSIQVFYFITSVIFLG